MLQDGGDGHKAYPVRLLSSPCAAVTLVLAHLREQHTARQRITHIQHIEEIIAMKTNEQNVTEVIINK
eukprot:scaffold244137_cov42-Prasinocladus_malaysianus.AAC.1